MNALDRFSDRLRNVERAGDRFKASCPVPDHGQKRGDQHPSLNYGVNAEGKVWFACRVGCSDEDVLAAMGLGVADLYERNGHGKNGTRKPAASWEIRDEAGEVQAVHVRFDHANGDKDCLWKLPDQNGWGLHGRQLATMPLYRSELVEGWPGDAAAIIVEGEKSADALAAVYPAVLGTVTGAGGTPGPEALRVLEGRRVILWPDHDDPGREHMRRVAEGLEGVASSVRVYEWSEAPDKGDAADHPAVISGDLTALLSEWTTASEPDASRNGHHQETPRFNHTDQGNAERLVHHHGNDLLYVEAWGSWLVWDSTRFQMDDTGEVVRRAKATVKQMFHEADPGNGAPIDNELAKHALRSQAATRIRDMISLAKSEPDIAARTSDFDNDPWLLNCENGTLDLRTGELRKHRREDRITKMAGTRYEPDTEAPTWLAFLERVLPSEQLRGFVQRLVGYALTGDVSEQILPFLYGTGANGKSTLVNTVLAMMGDYGQQAAPDLLLAKKGSHPTELADLLGARLVASVEVEDGRRMAESLVKQLTGGERVKARYMRQDFFEFDPTHKAFLVANHKPEIRGTDHAIWRRIKLVPFGVTIPDSEKDERLPEKLRDELPGILTWAVEGCLLWQRDGLGEPEEVTTATEGYRVEMDVLAAFIEERCFVGDRASALATPLWEEYRDWCSENGEDAGTQHKFGRRLRERGFERTLQSGTRKKMWRGIGLHDPTQPPDTGMLAGRGEA